MTLEASDAVVAAVGLFLLGCLIGANVVQRRWVRLSEQTDANWRAILAAVQAGGKVDFEEPPPRNRRKLRTRW